MAFVPAPGYQPVYNPTVPYHQPVPGGLRPGMSVYIQGTVLKHAKRFHVNFACGQHEGADIAIHFNPRFDGKDKIVLNTFQAGSWGSEEHHGMPFQKGLSFEIVFMVNDAGYQVMANRAPFCSYGHRIRPHLLTTISVDGDIELHSLSVIGGSESNFMGMPAEPFPQVEMPGMMLPPPNLPTMMAPAVYNPPTPYRTTLQGGLKAKSTVVIKGFIPIDAKRFTINFLAGQNIVLHINPRMDERVVVRNSFLNGNWGGEERDMPFNPFQPGQYFDFSIRCGNHRFKVYLNGQPFFNYAHRFHNFWEINTLQVEGDVVLSYVQC